MSHFRDRVQVGVMANTCIRRSGSRVNQRYFYYKLLYIYNVIVLTI